MGLMDTLRSLLGGGSAPKPAPSAGAAGPRAAAATPAGTGTAAAAAQSPPAGGDPIMGAALGLVGQGGSGLPALLDKLKAGGLGEHADIWVGSGDNMPVSAGGLTKALGAEQIAGIAAKTGLSEDAVASGLAKTLPAVIDKLTPEGTVPDAASLARHFSTQFGK